MQSWQSSYISRCKTAGIFFSFLIVRRNLALPVALRKLVNGNMFMAHQLKNILSFVRSKNAFIVFKSCKHFCELNRSLRRTENPTSTYCLRVRQKALCPGIFAKLKPLLMNVSTCCPRLWTVKRSSWWVYALGKIYSETYIGGSINDWKPNVMTVKDTSPIEHWQRHYYKEGSYVGDYNVSCDHSRKNRWSYSV